MKSQSASNTSQVRSTNLSQNQILSAALGITHDHGMQALTFRRLAQELQVSPMAVYRYYENKHALLTAMLDRFIADSDVLPDDPSLSWQDWLRSVAESMYLALIENPSWIPYIGQLPLKDNGLEVLDACLAKLRYSGFSQEQSTQAFFALLQTLFGAAIAEQQLKTSVNFLTKTLSHSPDQYPNISANLEELTAILKTSQIDIGLKILISGLV